MHAFRQTTTRRFAFEPLDRIVIKHREYRWISGDEFGHVLEPMLSLGQPITEAFSHQQLDDFERLDQLQHDVRYYDEAKAMARLKAGGATSLFHLSAGEQAKLLDRQEMLDLLLKQEAEDPSFVRTDTYIDKAMHGVYATISKRKAARAAEDKATRCDQTYAIAKCPSARTVRRWLKAYESGGLDVMALRDGYHRSGNPFSSLDPEVLNLINKHVSAWADIRRPTMAGQHEKLAGDIRRINETRVTSGEPPLLIPAKATFRKAIKAVPAFDAYAGRHGVEAAKRKFTIVSGGMEAIRPFQRLVMDGHKLQASTIAVKIGEWDLLSPKDKKEAERERLVLHASICTATRCFTGLRFSKTENKETAIATLRMSVSDKSRYAKAAGCKSDWPMAARPAAVHTDTGSAWIATEFRGSVADLRATLETAPVGVPQMRGHMERPFGTIDRGLLPNFTGRTFGNVVDKGDYDSEKHASVFSEKIGFILVRYIVDKYHHTPHASLNNMTPYDKWHELVDKYGILPPPGRDELRHIFGTKIERALDHRGVRVAGIHYQSPKLQEYRRRVGDGKVSVKCDPEDLGRVSIWVDAGWLSVPAMRGNFDGVHLDVWTEAMRDLRRRNLVKSSLSQHYVDDAIRAISAMGNLAMARANIAAPTITAEDLERHERELLYGFDIVGDNTDDGPVTANRDKDGNRDRFANAVPILDRPIEVNTTDVTPDNATMPPAAGATPNVRTRKPNLKLED
jgi:putative transposase